MFCTDCNVVYKDISSHDGHNSEMAYGQTYFSLGWGHLEARLQTAFVQVNYTLFLGHLMMINCLQFGWPVMISESAKLFGHRTQGALNYFYQCKDFHKTFKFIAAFSEAATKVTET